jgi:hypothetical protein
LGLNPTPLHLVASTGNLIEPRFVASAEYDHNFYGTEKYEYSEPSPTDNISWKNRGENLMLLRLHYLFF